MLHFHTSKITQNFDRDSRLFTLDCTLQYTLIPTMIMAYNVPFIVSLLMRAYYYYTAVYVRGMTIVTLLFMISSSIYHSIGNLIFHLKIQVKSKVVIYLRTDAETDEPQKQIMFLNILMLYVQTYHK